MRLFIVSFVLLNVSLSCAQQQVQQRGNRGGNGLNGGSGGNGPRGYGNSNGGYGNGDGGYGNGAGRPLAGGNGGNGLANLLSSLIDQCLDSAGINNLPGADQFLKGLRGLSGGSPMNGLANLAQQQSIGGMAKEGKGSNGLAGNPNDGAGNRTGSGAGSPNSASNRLAALIEKCLNDAGLNGLPGMDRIRDALRNGARNGAGNGNGSGNAPRNVGYGNGNGNGNGNGFSGPYGTGLAQMAQQQATGGMMKGNKA